MRHCQAWVVSAWRMRSRSATASWRPGERGSQDTRRHRAAARDTRRDIARLFGHDLAAERVSRWPPAATLADRCHGRWPLLRPVAGAADRPAHGAGLYRRSMRIAFAARCWRGKIEHERNNLLEPRARSQP